MNFCFSSRSDDNDVTIQPSDLNVPVFEVPKCTECPTNICKNSTFVIDLDKLQHLDGAKKDNFGKWTQSGSLTIPFRAWFSESGSVEFECLQPGSTAPDEQYLRRVHSHYPSVPRYMYKQMLAFITGL